MVMNKSPNKHNRLHMEARPMEESLAEAIDEGHIGPRDDPKNRAKILSEEFGLGQASCEENLVCWS